MREIIEPSLTLRLDRLRAGRCPLHDKAFVPMSDWLPERRKGLRQGSHYRIVECPHGGCHVQARAFTATGPWELFAQWMYLLQEQRPEHNTL